GARSIRGEAFEFEGGGRRVTLRVHAQADLSALDLLDLDQAVGHDIDPHDHVAAGHHPEAAEANRLGREWQGDIEQQITQRLHRIAEAGIYPFGDLRAQIRGASVGSYLVLDP